MFASTYNQPALFPLFVNILRLYWLVHLLNVTVTQKLFDVAVLHRSKGVSLLAWNHISSNDMNTLLSDGSVHTLVTDLNIPITISLPFTLLNPSFPTMTLVHNECLKDFVTFPTYYLLEISINFAYAFPYSFCRRPSHFSLSTTQRSTVPTISSGLKIDLVVRRTYLPGFFHPAVAINSHNKYLAKPF